MLRRMRRRATDLLECTTGGTPGPRLELVDVPTASPSRRRRRRRWLDIHDPGQYVRPFLERRALLLVVAVAVVDGRHRVVRDAAVIEHVRDVEPVDAGFAHIGRGRTAEVVRAKVE